MAKIYTNAKDKNVAVNIVYGSDDYYAFSDANKVNGMSKEELIDAFMKGMLIRTTVGYVVPVKLYVYDDYAKIQTGMDDTVLYSKEYSAPSDDSGHTPA